LLYHYACEEIVSDIVNEELVNGTRCELTLLKTYPDLHITMNSFHALVSSESLGETAPCGPLAVRRSGIMGAWKIFAMTALEKVFPNGVVAPKMKAPPECLAKPLAQIIKRSLHERYIPVTKSGYREAYIAG